MNNKLLEKMRTNIIFQEQKIEEHLKKLILGQTVTIKFLNINQYTEQTGMIIKIDKVKEILYLPNLKIPFADIIAIIS